MFQERHWIRNHVLAMMRFVICFWVERQDCPYSTGMAHGMNNKQEIGFAPTIPAGS
jgi:hypothetical protein